MRIPAAIAMFALLAGCTSERAMTESKLLSAGFVPFRGTAEVEARLAEYPAYTYLKLRGGDKRPKYVYSSPASKTIYLGDQGAHERLSLHLHLYQQGGPPTSHGVSGSGSVASPGVSRPSHTSQQIAPLPPSAVYLPDPSAPLPPPNIPSVIPRMGDIVAGVIREPMKMQSNLYLDDARIQKPIRSDDPEVIHFYGPDGYEGYGTMRTENGASYFTDFRDQ